MKKDIKGGMKEERWKGRHEVRRKAEMKARSKKKDGNGDTK